MTPGRSSRCWAWTRWRPAARPPQPQPPRQPTSRSRRLRPRADTLQGLPPPRPQGWHPRRPATRTRGRRCRPWSLGRRSNPRPAHAAGNPRPDGSLSAHVPLDAHMDAARHGAHAPAAARAPAHGPVPDKPPNSTHVAGATLAAPSAAPRLWWLERGQGAAVNPNPAAARAPAGGRWWTPVGPIATAADPRPAEPLGDALADALAVVDPRGSPRAPRARLAGRWPHGSAAGRRRAAGRGARNPSQTPATSPAARARTRGAPGSGSDRAAAGDCPQQSWPQAHARRPRAGGGPRAPEPWRVCAGNEPRAPEPWRVCAGGGPRAGAGARGGGRGGGQAAGGAAGGRRRT